MVGDSTASEVPTTVDQRVVRGAFNIGEGRTPV
jgi:hypothetical protein